MFQKPIIPLDSSTANQGNQGNIIPSAPPIDPTNGAPLQQNQITPVSGFNADAFNQLIRGKEMNPKMAQQLYEVLSTCEIVLLLDDSDSMTSPICEEGTDPFAVQNSTRWLELKKLAAEVIKFATVFNPDGIDLYFLNRQCYKGVKNMAGLQTIFSTQPAGGTPLISAINSILRERAYSLNPSKRFLLLLVITDGEPNDGNPVDQSRNQLYNVLYNKPDNVHISFAECTDQADDMNYLDQWKGLIKNFDNTDDYREEAQRVRNAQQNSQFKFDYTDYVIKYMLSTFNRWYFSLDTSKVASNTNNNTNYVPQYQFNPTNNTNMAQTAYVAPTNLTVANPPTQYNPQYQTQNQQNLQYLQQQTTNQNANTNANQQYLRQPPAYNQRPYGNGSNNQSCCVML